jgi:hypothetical protein
VALILALVLAQLFAVRFPSSALRRIVPKLRSGVTRYGQI